MGTPEDVAAEKYFTPPEPDKILNIYGQYAWHTEAKIVASRNALLALKNVIDRAIYYGYGEINEASQLFASDGEGYKLEVICLGEWSDKRWQAWVPEYSCLRRQEDADERA